MRTREALRLSWTNILSHKLRSLLATLGVMIGIGAVIAIITMLTGFQSSLLGVITQDLLRADTISITLEGSFGFFGGDRVFTERDLERLRALEGVKSADVGGQLRGGALYAGDKRILDASVVATTSPDLISLGVGRVIQGPGEIVLGPGIAEKVMEQLGLIEPLTEAQEDNPMFERELDYERVLGERVRLRYLNRERQVAEDALTVVGVVKESQFLSGTDSYVNISYHSDTETLDGEDFLVFSGIFVRAEEIDQIEAVRERVQGYLESEDSDVRRLVGEQLELDVQTAKELIDEINANFAGVAGFLGGIGGVALFVGMIGVMNIMLISVKERTREIGIMKATGATNGSVLKLFLTESTLICTLGAVLGIVLGLLGSRLLSTALIAVSQGLEEVPFVFTPVWYAVAVVTGILVGVISGVYPAWSAAKTDPIQALRYE